MTPNALAALMESTTTVAVRLVRYRLLRFQIEKNHVIAAVYQGEQAERIESLLCDLVNELLDDTVPGWRTGFTNEGMKATSDNQIPTDRTSERNRASPASPVQAEPPRRETDPIKRLHNLVDGLQRCDTCEADPNDETGPNVLCSPCLESLRAENAALREALKALDLFQLTYEKNTFDKAPGNSHYAGMLMKIVEQARAALAHTREASAD